MTQQPRRGGPAPLGIRCFTCMDGHAWIIDVVFQLLHSTGWEYHGNPSIVPQPNSFSCCSFSSSFVSSIPNAADLRLRPLIPPLSWPALYPALGIHLDSAGDVPLQLQARRMLHKALGGSELHSLESVGRQPGRPGGSAPDLPRGPVPGSQVREGPFCGDFSMVTWNTQALFAADCSRHALKRGYVDQLMGRHEVGIWTETHGTVGGNRTWREPCGCVSWWAPWVSTACAGVGITVKESFLANLDATLTVWDIIIPGRAAVLKLRGARGLLHIWAVYFPTGAEVHDADWNLLLPGCPRRPSFPEIRAAMRRCIAHRLEQCDQALVVLAGDFNYVADAGDRVSLNSGVASGRRDKSEELHWTSSLGRWGIREMYQGSFTHASAAARSRLDRFYSNLHQSEFLNKHITTTVLEWVPHLSAHRAVVFGKRSAQKPADHRPIPQAVYKHPDFARRVILSFKELEHDSPDVSAVQRLVMLKQALRQVGDTFEWRPERYEEATGLEDRLGTTLRFIWAVETQNVSALGGCLARYPHLGSLCPNPYAMIDSSLALLVPYRLHARELARDHALDELGKLRAEMHQLTDDQIRQRRQRNQRLLAKLAPGKGGSVQALRTPQGKFVTDPAEIVSHLKDH